MTGQYDAFLDLYLDGTRADDLLGQLRSVEVHEHSFQASTFRITLALGFDEDDDLDALKDGRFTLLRRVTIGVRLTPVSGETTEFRALLLDGYITAVEPDLSPARYSKASLVLEGLDTLAALHIDERNRAWNEKTDAEIARAVFTEYGLGADVAADTPQRAADRANVLQRGTDAELLRQLARRNGFCFYVEPREGEVRPGAAPREDVIGHFHLPRLDGPPQPAITVQPGETSQTLGFRARWTALAPTTVTGAHIDERSRRLQTHEERAGRLPKLGSHGRADLLSARLPEILPTRTGVEARARAAGDAPHDARDLEGLTWASFRDADWLAEARATVDGLRYPGVLRARRTIQVERAGAILNGTWWVRSACHRLVWDAVPRRYEVDLDLTRNALGGVA